MKPSRNWSLRAGACLTVAFVLIAVIATFWTPYDPAALSIVEKLQSPSSHHWLGTDQLGRDVLSMIMSGARTSVGVALLAVLIGAGIGIPLGLTAAARRGAIDEFIMRGNDLIFAFPALLSAILITSVFGPGAINAIIAIGIFNIPVFARVARAGALQQWTREYALAARIAGKNAFRISWEHILPNLLALLFCFTFWGLPTGLGATLIVGALILRRAGPWWRREQAALAAVPASA